MTTLYIVATPIGNLEDISLRALRVLREVGLIAAEDTRTTRKLLNRYDIKQTLTSYNEHNRAAKIPKLMETLKTKSVALVSEAGTPEISDPGYELVLEAIKSGVPVVPIPGPSAVVASLAASGLPPGGFMFLGFLPRRKGQRRRLLDSLRSQTYTLVAFEAPHRLHASLQEILEALGDRDIAVCRELTKVHEEIFHGNVAQALAHFSEPRGEFTLVIGGAGEEEVGGDVEWAKEELRRLKLQGLKAKEAVPVVSRAAGVPRREVYRLWLEIGSP